MIPFQGISVECVASEIGALGRKKLAVERERLIAGLYRRVPTARPYEADWAIHKGLKTGQLLERDGMIMVAREPAKPAPKFYFTVEDGAEFISINALNSQLWRCPACDATFMCRWWARTLGDSIEECLSCGAAFSGVSWMGDVNRL
jgi:hypothetical protein